MVEYNGFARHNLIHCDRKRPAGFGWLARAVLYRAGVKMHEQGTTSVCPVEVRAVYPVVCCPSRSRVARLRSSDRPRSEHPSRGFVEVSRVDANRSCDIG